MSKTLLGSGWAGTAAFQASYSDWKLIRTRKVVQLVFEVPVEHADDAYQVLGGMPNSGEEIWCGIARLKPDTAPVLVEEPARAQWSAIPVWSEQFEAEPPKRRLEQPRTPVRFDEMTMTAQAGMLSNDPAFKTFLNETQSAAETPEEIAHYIRLVCGVKSRADIQPTCAAGKIWLDIVKQYRTWQLAPKVGAA